MTDWTTADIPPLNGKTAVITGATGGLGYETALALAGAGAVVVLTGRNDAKGRNAIQSIRAQFPDPKSVTKRSIWPALLPWPNSLRAS
jgi:NAD(P)-dependent dehydrogenase (short-subunit alcohol dehydrogenase family)